NSTRSGRVIAGEWSLKPLLDASGQVTGVASLVQDVTEQRAADEALRRSEERYRLLFERNLAAVYWATAEGELVDCNQSFAQMFGFASRSQVMMRHALDIFGQIGNLDVLRERLRQEGSLTNLESLCLRADGTPIWVLQNISLVEDGSGVPMIQGTMIDITERKHAEETLRQNERRLRRQNEMLVELSTRKIVESGDLENALVEITEAAAEILEVEYASVWLLNEDRTILRCVNLFSRSQNSHTRGKEYY